MSGGEAMLRPKLVGKLAQSAREVGTRSIVLSGMFFARLGHIPRAIREAIETLDHFSASLDVFHEREVPRVNVFRVIESLVEDGTDVSFHIVGKNADDPYLESVVEEVQHVFGRRVPMLVNTIASFGRAKAWHTPTLGPETASIDAEPCGLAAWPVVGFDGTIAACANDDVLDNVPPHLRLGHASVDDWATIRARTLASNMVRAIRLFGPEYIADRFSDRGRRCGRYCQTCMNLSKDPSIEQRVDQVMAKPTSAVLEEQASAMQRRAGALVFAKHYGLSRYAELVALGAPT